MHKLALACATLAIAGHGLKTQLLTDKLHVRIGTERHDESEAFKDLSLSLSAAASNRSEEHVSNSLKAFARFLLPPIEPSAAAFNPSGPEVHLQTPSPSHVSVRPVTLQRLDSPEHLQASMGLKTQSAPNCKAAKAIPLIERSANATSELPALIEEESDSGAVATEVLPPEDPDDLPLVHANDEMPPLDPGILMVPYRMNADWAGLVSLDSDRQRQLQLQQTNRVVQIMESLWSKLGRRPTYSEVARYMDRSGLQTYTDRYNFHLNALSVIRKKHDLLYAQDAFPLPEDRSEIEGLLPANPKSRADLRQKGPDGESFVALIEDPSVPKSLYLQNISNRFEHAGVFTKLDEVIEEFALQQKEAVAKEDFFRAFGFVDPDTIDDHGRILARLGLQVIKRRRLGEPQLDSRTLWSRIVARTDEIYQVAEKLQDAYRLAIIELLYRVGLDESSFIFGPLKDPVRTYEKAVDDYSSVAGTAGDGVLPEAWVGDVVRGGIVASDGRKMIEFEKLLLEQKGLQLGGIAGNTKLRHLRVKNKFSNPGPTRFRYILNNLELTVGSLSMVCEVQVHHELILLWDGKLDSHYHYDFFRAALKNETKNTLARPGETLDFDAEIDRRLNTYEDVFRALFWYALDQWSDIDDEENVQEQADPERVNIP